MLSWFLFSVNTHIQKILFWRLYRFFILCFGLSLPKNHCLIFFSHFKSVSNNSKQINKSSVSFYTRASFTPTYNTFQAKMTSNPRWLFQKHVADVILGKRLTANIFQNILYVQWRAGLHFHTLCTLSQSVFICSKLTIETLEQGVTYVQI